MLSPEGAFLYFTWFVFFTIRGTDTAYKSVTLHLKLAHGVTIARGTDTAYKSVTLHLKLAHGVTIARGDRYCL